MLSVGSNNGGPRRTPLRYAASDAQAMSKLFQELGGVDDPDQVLLADPDGEAFWHGFQDLRERIAEAEHAHGRVELFVYYSGHSDENGLLLGEESVSYRELREAVGSMPADVRVIILDSCASGALTRLKGGKRRRPFLIDESAQMKGHAFLTSSSEDEAAQESDRIEGSFFTHSLVSGLRGAADVTQDKKITLNEAYQFAFYETMAKTEGTQSGTQHPAYDIQMVGAGDLVMTDLRGTSAGLVLDEAITGRLRIRDAQNALVVELTKPPGRPIELGLEPGEYRVILERDGVFHRADLTLVDGRRTGLGPEDFSFMASEFTTSRGAEPPPPLVRAGRDEHLQPRLSVSLWPGMSTNSPDDDRAISTVSINLTVGRTGGIRGFEWGYLANWDLGDMVGLQVAHGVNLVQGNLEGVQIASLANVVRGDAVSFQATGLLNLTHGRFTGVQSSGFGNFVGGDMEGLQVAGLGNFTNGHCEGAQILGVVNGAQTFRGVQLGILNIAGDAHGGQFGLINIARSVKGTQIGFLNIAHYVKGAPIGVVSFVKQGRHNLALWRSDTADFNFGIKLGNQHVYSILAGGRETLGETERRFFGLGLGVHIPRGNQFVNFDLLTSGIEEGGRDTEKLHMLHKARFGLGWQLAGRFALVGGATVNVFTSRLNDGSDFAEDTWHDSLHNGTWVKVWPGFFLGVQI